MKKFIFIFAIALLSACSPAKFVITSNDFTTLADYCLFGIKPINKKAVKLSHEADGIYVECGSYKVGDTIVLTKKEFTNY